MNEEEQEGIVIFHITSARCALERAQSTLEFMGRLNTAANLTSRIEDLNDLLEVLEDADDKW